jgi:D-alanine-D-alanine ligase
VVPETTATKINMHIEIVGSTNARVDAINPGSRLTVQAALKERYTTVGITIVNNIADLEALIAKKPDLVVLGIKRVPLDETVSYDESPKIWPSDYLNKHGIVFTGSDTKAFDLVADKQVAKQKIIDAGLHSAAYFVADKVGSMPSHALRFPLFVKPTNRSASQGIDEMSVVYNQAALTAKVADMHASLDGSALIEEYLPGREFSITVIRQPLSESLLALPLEISNAPDTNGNSFLSQAVKKADIENYGAVSDPVLKKTLSTLAIDAFTVLGARDYARIDMRLNAAGVPHFIEANLMPGLADSSYLIQAFTFNNHGSYPEMVRSIVSLALERRTIRRKSPRRIFAPLT